MVLSQIALTGASGMLGSHIAKKLADENYKVIALSRKKPKIKNKNVIFRKFDIKKRYTKKKFESFFKDSDIIIHAGCTTNYSKEKNKFFSFKMNLNKTREIGRISYLNNKKLIFISGAIIYQNQKIKNDENSKVKKNIKDLYIKSKIVSEKILTKFSRQGLHLIILRPSSIYGNGQKSSKIITKLVKKSSIEKKIYLYESQRQVNLIHASDVANFILLAIKTKKKAKGIYNVGGTLYTYKDIGKTLKKLFNCKIIEDKSIKNLKKETIKLNISSRKSKSTFNWKSKIKLKTGLISIKNNEII